MAELRTQNSVLTMFELSETIGRLTVNFHARLIGRDWDIAVCGGSLRHIGAVALASPNTLCSVMCLPGHREGEIAQHLASALANHANTTVCVVCGIHLDDISPEEILSVNSIAEKFISEFVARI